MSRGKKLTRCAHVVGMCGNEGLSPITSALARHLGVLAPHRRKDKWAFVERYIGSTPESRPIKNKPKPRTGWMDRLSAEREIVLEDTNARLSFLLRWAREVVGRPQAGVRESHRGLLRRAHLGCWTGCGGRHDVSHHIVQVQHGGDNRNANRVRLCHACHALIHPWLNPDGTVKPEALTKRMSLPSLEAL